MKFTTPTEYLSQLLQDLEDEKNAERQSYEEEREKTSLQDKKAAGIAWYPLELEIETYPISGKVLLSVTKKADSITPEFQSGASVIFYSTELGSKEMSFGTIVSLKENQAKVLLHGDELPDWMEEKPIALEKYYDESTYQEMERALNILQNPQEPTTKKLISLFTGFSEPSFETRKFTDDPHLNASQNKARGNLMAAQDLGIIHGPPGTGKTKTLIELSASLVKQEGRLLLTAASNVAVDLLTEKAKERGLRTVRIGNPARVSEKILELTLDYQIQNHPDYKSIVKLKREAKELLRKAEKFKRSFGPKEREERKANKKEAREIFKYASSEETRIAGEILGKAEIVTSTLMGLTGFYMQKEEFQTILIDEATQCLEPLLWIAILKTKKRIFLAGDHFQLPPTTHAQNSPFMKTLFEKMIEKFPKPPITNLLSIQYRMHPNLVKFSNSEFYGNELQTHDSVNERSSINDFPWISDNKAIAFIDTAGTDFQEQWEESTESFWNSGEIKAILKLLEIYRENPPSQTLQMGILSPYREQVERLKKEVKQLDPIPNMEIHVNTIDSFQGSERDIIWISLVRSNDTGEIGFLKDTRRMNVAMTRAKRELVLVGDGSTISQSMFYSKILSFIEKEGKYLSIWEYL